MNTDIFNNDYFEDDVMESYAYDVDYDLFDFVMEANTALNTGIAGINPLLQTIHRVVHQGRKEKSVVISVAAMQRNGMTLEDAKKEAKRTIKAFVERDFLPDYFIKNDVNTIYYGDLTPYGKQFMDGFYDAMDNIEPYDIRKGISAKRKPGYEKGSRWGSALSIAWVIASAISVSFTGWGLVALILSCCNLAHFNREVEGSDLFDNTHVE
jgi:hypothetical protein